MAVVESPGRSPMKQPGEPNNDATTSTLEETNTLISRVTSDWQKADPARRWHENKVLVRALFNTKGYYMPRMDEGGSLLTTSQAFVSLTRPKIQTAVSLLMPVVMPPGDDAFAIDPDPDACDPDLAAKLLQQRLSLDEIRSQMHSQSVNKANRLTSKIAKGLDFTKFGDKNVRFLYDLCTFGTGVMMGPFPVVNPEASESGEPNQNAWDSIISLIGLGQKSPMEQVVEAGLLDKYMPYLEVVSPLNFYPDPAATSVEQMRFFIDRMVMGKPQIQEMLNDPSFIKSAVEKVLHNHPDGIWEPCPWESMVNTLNNQPNTTSASGRFVCLNWWGFMTGKDLNDGGIDIPEERWSERVVVNLWKIGGQIVKVVVSDLHKDRLPVYVVPYSYSPNTIWGVGPAELMFDAQDSANAAERQLMDNLAMISGPMADINVNMLADPTAQLSIGPKKIILTKESTAGATRRAVEFLDLPIKIQEILAILHDCERLAQEQTGLPNFLQGTGQEGVHNRTFGGANLQFNNALTPLKTAVYNIEQHLTVPMITNMVRFFQLYSKDPDIGGKFMVSCNGVRGLIARETMISTVNDTLNAIGQIPGAADHCKFDNILNAMFRISGFVNEDFTKPQQQVDQERQQKQQQELEAKAYTSGLDAAPKMRAEVAPREALMDLVKESEDGTPLKLALMQKAIQEYNLMTPEIQEAIATEDAKMGIKTHVEAYNAGAGVADASLAPVPHPTGGKWQDAIMATQQQGGQ